MRRARGSGLFLLSAALLGGFCCVPAMASPQAFLPAPPPLPPEILEKGPPTPPPNLPDPSELLEQLRQLEELLSMPADKLQRLRQTIEFIEKMPEAEREAMRIRLSQVTRMNADLRQEIDRMSTLAPRVRKSDLSQYWLAASEEERDSLRAALAALSHDRKGQLLQEKVDAFVEKRDQAFARMRESLEERRKALSEPKD
jgi:hypothetical protein